jgi:FMN phosphatase YigB (HAD superfamily)
VAVAVRAVFFDIGETLINETRIWSALADWLDVPRMTLFGVLGGLISARKDHRELIAILRPGMDWEDVVTGFSRDVGDGFTYEDLYPDVVPTLGRLQTMGYFVGIAGNQPERQEERLRAMSLPHDLLATSGGWGLRKPDRAFFDRIVAESGFPPHEIGYVGDRVDNDVIASGAAGLVPIHLVRGPWGYLQREWPEAARARARFETLEELPQALAQL